MVMETDFSKRGCGWFSDLGMCVCVWQGSLECLAHKSSPVNRSTGEPLAVTGRVAVSGNSHILYMWKLSSGVCSVSLSVCRWSDELRRNITVKCFSSCSCYWSSCLLPCLLQDRSPYVQVSGQSEIPGHGHRCLQGCDPSSSGGQLSVKGEDQWLSSQSAHLLSFSCQFYCKLSNDFLIENPNVSFKLKMLSELSNNSSWVSEYL